MKILSRLLPAVASVAATAVLIPAALAGTTPSAPSVTPAAGVFDYNHPMCGTNWVDVHIPRNSYYNIYNATEGQARTCLIPMRLRLDYQIWSVDYRQAWGYPNISSGWEWGRNPCTGHSGACFRYPVQERRDGEPQTSVRFSLHPGRYNAAYDIWFNKTDAHPGQDNGTEVMVWLAHPGLSEGFDRYVSIDGIEWGVMEWTADHNNTRWHYVAYVAVHQRPAVNGLWLNPFFRNAIAHHELSPYWWLTAIDVGNELVSGGQHTDILSYSLRGVQ